MFSMFTFVPKVATSEHASNYASVCLSRHLFGQLLHPKHMGSLPVCVWEREGEREKGRKREREREKERERERECVSQPLLNGRREYYRLRGDYSLTPPQWAGWVFPRRSQSDFLDPGAGSSSPPWSPSAGLPAATHRHQNTCKMLRKQIHSLIRYFVSEC